jgi:hypothetical protein
MLIRRGNPMSNTISQKIITFSIGVYLILSPFAIGVSVYNWRDYKDRYKTLQLNNQIDSLDRECDAIISSESIILKK